MISKLQRQRMSNFKKRNKSRRKHTAVVIINMQQRPNPHVDNVTIPGKWPTCNMAHRDEIRH